MGLAPSDPDQFVLDLLSSPEPSLEDGVPGRNHEALTWLAQFCENTADDTAPSSLLLWGAPGCGKTFWLTAWARASEPPPILLDCRQRDAEALAREGLEANIGPQRLWLIDNLDAASPPLQGILFRLWVGLRERGQRLVCSAGAAPARLTHLREDLRTRLGQGLIFELTELSEPEQLQALRERAHRLGWMSSPLSESYDHLFGYMLTRLPRNLAFLTRLMDAANSRALALQRPISLPLVRALFESSLMHA